MFRYVTGLKPYERRVIHSSVATDTGVALHELRVFVTCRATWALA